ncbi:septation protein SepH [Nocardioides sp.]|uniref:septation protein SepH n=1 Tax=Nocardioides sp. TaxID=35761 RepID=UPI00286E1757|nr:septation protein SepH [Nocardioides sp.]
MAHLTLAGLSDDGLRLLLVDDNGAEFTLDIDAQLRATLRGEHARIGQLEIQMDSALRPRDIQTRIRGGESPESVAQAAQTTVEKIMVFAAPVLAERAHIAQRAQSSSLRRKAGDTGARTLGEAISAHLHTFNVDPAVVEWDAWRREDGRWTLTGSFRTSQRKGKATFAFDVRGNFVTSEDEDARWLVGEPVSRPAASAQARDDLQPARVRRLNAVPADELPLGEDAIELVTDEADSVDEVSPAETTIDLTEAGLGTEQSVEAYLSDDTPDDTSDDPERNASEHDPAAAVADEHDPAEDEPPSRRPARKARGRASVPSWDEIMFGGPSD